MGFFILFVFLRRLDAGFFFFVDISGEKPEGKKHRFDTVGEPNCLPCYRSSAAIIKPLSRQLSGHWEGMFRQVCLGSRAAIVRCLQESPAQLQHHISLTDSRELCVISSDAASSFKSRFCVFIPSRLFLIDPFWRVW